VAMPRKHYRELAEIIRGSYEMHLSTEMHPREVQNYVLQGMAAQLAWMFSQDNDRFDRDQFMAACFPKAEDV